MRGISEPLSFRTSGIPKCVSYLSAQNFATKKQQVIIAIDGPAGSGKSTTARAVAAELGFFYVDTGAMYRAFGVAFLRAGADASTGAINRLLEDTTISLEPSHDGHRVTLNGEDVTDFIRRPEVSDAASAVARIPTVRRSMVDRQRAIAAAAVQEQGGAILEGRDIGTVVFPNAELKIFLDADLEERARRRLIDLSRNGAGAEEIKEQIRRRDAADQTRSVAPLRVAEDAVRIDTTDLTFEQQVGQIVGLARDLIHRNR